MKQNMLESTLKQNQIFGFFDGVAGLNDHYAVSKIERGEHLIAQHKLVKENTIIIGDTIHDFEVAEKLGIECILIANGHQSAERLKETGCAVLSQLKDLYKLLF
jgi:phosphoglycolate phosphatase